MLRRATRFQRRKSGHSFPQNVPLTGPAYPVPIDAVQTRETPSKGFSEEVRNSGVSGALSVAKKLLPPEALETAKIHELVPREYDQIYRKITELISIANQLKGHLETMQPHITQLRMFATDARVDVNVRNSLSSIIVDYIDLLHQSAQHGTDTAEQINQVIMNINAGEMETATHHFKMLMLMDGKTVTTKCNSLIKRINLEQQANTKPASTPPSRTWSSWITPLLTISSCLSLMAAVAAGLAISSGIPVNATTVIPYIGVISGIAAITYNPPDPTLPPLQVSDTIKSELSSVLQSTTSLHRYNTKLSDARTSLPIKEDPKDIGMLVIALTEFRSGVRDLSEVANNIN